MPDHVRIFLEAVRYSATEQTLRLTIATEYDQFQQNPTETREYEVFAVARSNPLAKAILTPDSEGLAFPVDGGKLYFKLSSLIRCAPAGRWTSPYTLEFDRHLASQKPRNV